MTWRAHTGVAVRAMVRTYLQAIAFVMFALLVVALSIDLSDTLETIRARAAEQGVPLWRLLLPYAGYRAVDIVVRLLGMACLIGAGAATLLRHQRMEDAVLAAAGGSPRLTLSALVMVGVVTGAVQAGLQNWVRPPAVEAQVEMQLGRYGRWFGRTELEHQWFIDGGRALRARVTRGTQAGLSEVALFEGLDRPALERIVWAERTHQVAPGRWRLEDVTEWRRVAGDAMTRKPVLEIAFPLNFSAVRWYDVHGYYIPNPALRRISALEGTEAASDAATALAFRTMAFFLPGVFALLGTSLAMAGRLGRRLAPFRLLLLAAAGYVMLVSVKVFWALGIHAQLPPYPAATIPMGVALAVSALMQLRMAGYLRLRL